MTLLTAEQIRELLGRPGAYVQQSATVGLAETALALINERDDLIEALDATMKDRDRWQENHRHVVQGKRNGDNYKEAFRARAELAERQLEEARGVLENFAGIADFYGSAHQDSNQAYISIGTLRAARRFLEQEGK